MNVRINEIGLPEPEPLGLKIHPWSDGKPMSDHVTGHNKQQNEHDDNRTGLEGSRQGREVVLAGSGGERDGLFRKDGQSRYIRSYSLTQRGFGLRRQERDREVGRASGGARGDDYRWKWRLFIDQGQSEVCGAVERIQCQIITDMHEYETQALTQGCRDECVVQALWQTVQA